MVRQYHVVKSTKAKGIAVFIRMINDDIKGGWVLQGGISVDTHHYYQAMVKGGRV